MTKTAELTGRELDAAVKRPCGICGSLDIKWYGVRKNRTCLNCKRIRWHGQKHPPEFIRYQREWRMKRRYGITPEQYDALVIGQNGRCAVCGKPEDAARRLCIDHCHETGVVRGLLCDSCNRGLAQFKDKPEIMQAGIDYLRAALKAVEA